MPCCNTKVYTSKANHLISASTVDIVASNLALPDAALNAGQYHPFTLSGTIEPAGFSYPQSDWPHFFIAFYLSTDAVLDDNDYRIPYELTSCQVYTLSGSFSAGSTHTLDLNDMRKFLTMLHCTDTYSFYSRIWLVSNIFQFFLRYLGHDFVICWITLHF